MFLFLINELFLNLRYDLSKLCTEGPKRQLDEIKYSHAAIFTASLGCLEQLREERPETVFNCVGTAGFSLGEYTALVFAGALRFEDGNFQKKKKHPSCRSTLSHYLLISSFPRSTPIDSITSGSYSNGR